MHLFIMFNSVELCQDRMEALEATETSLRGSLLSTADFVWLFLQ